MRAWLRAWREQRRCFHHDNRTGESYVGRGMLVDLGRRKVYECSACGRVWVI